MTMSPKDRFDACVKLAEMSAQRHDARRQYEWKVSLGLWLALLAVVLLQVFASRSLMLLAFRTDAIALGALLALWSDQGRASSEVKKLAHAHATELGEKILEMQAMQRTLLDLSIRCRGNQRPDCPILDDLAG